jgi:hypothetical protein
VGKHHWVLTHLGVVGIGSACGATRAVRPAAEMNDGSGAPVVGGGEEVVVAEPT